MGSEGKRVTNNHTRIGNQYQLLTFQGKDKDWLMDSSYPF